MSALFFFWLGSGWILSFLFVAWICFYHLTAYQFVKRFPKEPHTKTFWQRFVGHWARTPWAIVIFCEIVFLPMIAAFIFILHMQNKYPDVEISQKFMDSALFFGFCFLVINFILWCKLVSKAK